MTLDSHTNATMIDDDENCYFMEEQLSEGKKIDLFTLSRKIKNLDIMKMLKEKSNRKGN
jgi:hypothetical protein